MPVVAYGYGRLVWSEMWYFRSEVTAFGEGGIVFTLCSLIKLFTLILCVVGVYHRFFRSRLSLPRFFCNFPSFVSEALSTLV